MIDIRISVEQDGPDLTTTVYALADPDATEAENRTATHIIDLIQKRVVDLGGDATFIERPGTADEQQQQFPSR